MAKQYKLKFKPTPIARLLKRSRSPMPMVGYPTAYDWSRYYQLNYEFMIAEKRKGQPEVKPRKPRPVAIDQTRFQSALLDHNYRKIGHGAYANVYAKPNSDIVVKVGQVPDSWPAYAKWATEQGFAGTFAPKVYSLKFYKPIGKSPYYVATMERLVDTISGIKETAHHRPNELTILYNKLVDTIVGATNDYGDLSDHPDLKAFGEALGNKDFRWDLHDDNVMVRKDGQIVVTDPQSESRDSDFRIRKGTVTHV